MKIIKFKNHLLLKGNYPTFKAKSFRIKDTTFTAIPYALKYVLEAKQLNLLNVDFIKPIKYTYNIGPYDPFKHQKDTTKFLVNNYKAFCWNEAGTGKTASCIWAYDFLRKQKLAKKLLIICPLSTAKAVWRQEIFKLLTPLKSEILIGTQKQRLKLLNKNLDAYIINHDGIKVIESELIAWQPDIIIVDEFTAFKNQRTGRWHSLRNLAKVTKFLWMLSGTPISQAPTDLYAPAKLICPDLVGRSFLRFKYATMHQISMYKWVPKSDFERVLQRKIKPVIRFSRQECLDLPTVLSHDYFVDMSKHQQIAFDKLRKEAIFKSENEEVTAVNEGVMRSKLLQCCGGFVYTTDKSVINLSPTARFEATKDIINETTHGVLIFAAFRSMLSRLEMFLRKDFAVRSVTGSTSLTMRSDYFKQFQQGALKVLIAHPRTMGHGVTLTYADTIIWYNVTSDNELYQQANSRIQRIGQDHKMRIIHLISTALEKNVLKRLGEKRSMQGVLLETLKNN